MRALIRVSENPTIHLYRLLFGMCLSRPSSLSNCVGRRSSKYHELADGYESADHRCVVRCPHHSRLKHTDYYFTKDQETQVNAEGNVLNAATFLFMLYLTALLTSLLRVGILVALLVHHDAEGLEEQEFELLGVTRLCLRHGPHCQHRRPCRPLAFLWRLCLRQHPAHFPPDSGGAQYHGAPRWWAILSIGLGLRLFASHSGSGVFARVLPSFALPLYGHPFGLVGCAVIADHTAMTSYINLLLVTQVIIIRYLSSLGDCLTWRLTGLSQAGPVQLNNEAKPNVGLD
jgi:hypothetical protein